MTDRGGRLRSREWRRRVIWTAVAGVLVLSIAGWVAKPSATVWWVARSACDGALPDGVLDRVEEDWEHDEGHLDGYEEATYRQLGRYRCEVKDESDGRGYRFKAEAFTAGDDIHAQFAEDFQDVLNR